MGEVDAVAAFVAYGRVGGCGFIDVDGAEDKDLQAGVGVADDGVVEGDFMPPAPYLTGYLAVDAPVDDRGL